MVDRMKEELEESLSALVDGELDQRHSDRLADELMENANAREIWQRYHLVRNTLRKNLPDSLSPDLFDRVSNAIASEPAHNIATEPKMEKKPLWGFGFQPAYGFVAAAALVVAFVTVTQIEQSTTDFPEVAKLENSNITAPANSNIANLASNDIHNAPRADNGSQLSAYLANHSARSQSYPMQNGLLPYVISAGYTDE